MQKSALPTTHYTDHPIAFSAAASLATRQTNFVAMQDASIVSLIKLHKHEWQLSASNTFLGAPGGLSAELQAKGALKEDTGSSLL